MFEDARKVTCEEFQSQIPELLSSGAAIQHHAHLKACASCSRLLFEIETISVNARQFHFGTREPGADDWSEST